MLFLWIFSLACFQFYSRNCFCVTQIQRIVSFHSVFVVQSTKLIKHAGLYRSVNLWNGRAPQRCHTETTNDDNAAIRNTASPTLVFCRFHQALIPSIECLTPPGGVLFDLLSGHTHEITAVTLTSDGMRALTSSLDDTIKLWDLRTGRVVKTLEGVGAKVTSLRTAKNNTVLVTVEGAVIKLWSARTGACLLTVDDRPDPASVCVALEGQVLVALHEGTNTFRSWEMDSFNKLCEVRTVLPSFCLHVKLSVFLYLPLSLSPSVSVSLCLCLPLCLSLSLCFSVSSLSVSLSLFSLSLCVCARARVCARVCVSLSLFIPYSFCFAHIFVLIILYCCGNCP